MEKYDKIRVVGRGAHGTVYLCHRLSDKSLVIVKEIPVQQMTKDERQTSLNEAKVLSMLDHPNIIAYYENFLEDKTMVIVMEYAQGGTLFEYLQQRKGMLLQEEEVLYYFAQMVHALQHVHSRQILHRDLKSQNILLNEKKDIVKVGDFGISKILSSKSKACTVVGTPCYISPELCEGKPYNQKSDIWALGCVLYELLTLKRPFDANNLPALVMKIMRGCFDPVSDHYSRDLRQLLMNMLHLDPNKRPAVCQIMSQPFMISTAYRLYVDIGSLKCISRPRKLSSRTSLSQIGSPLNKSSGSDQESLNSAESLEPLSFSAPEYGCSVWFLSGNSQNPLLLPLPSLNTIVKSVSVGKNQKAGVTENGYIVTWELKDEDSKTAVTSFFSATLIEEKFAINIVSVACGDNFTVCLTDNGVVLTFGKGVSGCLAHGNEDDVPQPKIVEALFGFNVISVACGSSHVLVVSEEKDLFAWGQGKNGCLGLGKAESYCLPQRVTISSGKLPTKVYCGIDCSFVVTTDMSLLACGSNRHNKLAMDTEDGHHIEESRVFTPVHSDPLAHTKVNAVAAGAAHIAVLTDRGEVYTTGSNRYGQLGWGQPGVSHSMPGKVEALASHTVTQVSCGDQFTLAVTSDDSIFAWGRCPKNLHNKINPCTANVEKSIFSTGHFTILSAACDSEDCLIVTKTKQHGNNLTN